MYYINYFNLCLLKLKTMPTPEYKIYCGNLLLHTCYSASQADKMDDFLTSIGVETRITRKKLNF